MPSAFDSVKRKLSPPTLVRTIMRTVSLLNDDGIGRKQSGWGRLVRLARRRHDPNRQRLGGELLSRAPAADPVQVAAAVRRLRRADATKQ